jgi:2C-methyl-D-erythritol 2,4-cyclodiphosphate synthase
MSKTTSKSITEQRISLLRTEALSAGDYAMAAICDLAIDGAIDTDDYSTLSTEEARRVDGMTQHDAVAECVRVVSAADAA